MRLGGRVAAAIEVIEAVDGRHRPVSEALKDWGQAHRFAGAGDRAAIGNLVYDALRKRSSHAWVTGEDTPSAIIFSALLRQWGLSPEQLQEAFAGDAHAPEIPVAKLQAALARDLAEAPDHVRADAPSWCAPHLQASFGDEWVKEAAALTGRPPLDLRANTLKSTRDKVLKELARTGAVAARLAPHGIRIPAGEGPARLPNVTAEPGYRKGWFEVQDEGSQVAALLAARFAGRQALDLCAGAGGKTLALSAAMENKGQIHATDADKTRLAPIFERLQRAGCRNVQVHPAGADLGALEARMDLVLVDAPCTGSGTWRRRPDAKWKLTEKALAERLDEQRTVLDEAARFVKRGGALVYVTCSVFAEENGGQVAAHRQRHPHFDPVELAPHWRALFGQDAAQPHADAVGGVTLTPARTGTDGFYVAVMVRKG